MTGIKRLIFTEKFTQLLEQYNIYTFEVNSYLTKIQIRWLTVKVFIVPIRNVNTSRIAPATSRMKNFYRMRCTRAVVYVKQKIGLTLSGNDTLLFWSD